jgi:hypothetical protein
MNDLARKNGNVLVSSELFWNYYEPKYDGKLLLLTNGGIAVIGNWESGSYKAFVYIDDLVWTHSKPFDESYKMLIKTNENMIIIGNWFGDYGQYFKAYCHLPKRDKERENELGVLIF